LPELATSIFSVFKGATEFIAGNVIGSNIANILLVVGVAAIISKSLKINWDIVTVDLPMLLASAFALALVLWDGVFSFGEAVVLLIGYIIYVEYYLAMHRNSVKPLEKKEKMSWKIPAILIVSAIGIYFGAEYTVRSVIELTKILGFKDTSILALSAVAIGTSLPELTVSITAALKKNYEIALGNALGSNIFNSFVVMSIPRLFSKITVSQSVITIGIPFMLAASLLFFVSTFPKVVTRYEGKIYVLIFLLFLAKLFGLF